MKLRTHLAAICGTILLSAVPTFAQADSTESTGYTRTYVIQADAAWVGPGMFLEPAFVQISDGRIDWIAEVDHRTERKNMFGQSTGKTPLIKVPGTLAPGMIDAWSGMAPQGYTRDRKPGPTRRVEDALPVQAPREDLQLMAQVLAARHAGVSATYLEGGRNGLRRGVGTAVEFTALDLPLQAGDTALEFAVGAAAAGGVERTFQMEELRLAFEEAKDWRASWDDYDEALEKYQKDLEKYEEKLTKYIEEKKAFEEKQEAEGAMSGEGEEKEKAPKAPKRPKVPKKPKLDAARDLLLDAMDGKMTVRVVADRVSDIRDLIRLKADFGLDLILVGGYDADFLAEALAKAEIPVILPVVADHHAQPDPERGFAKRYLGLREAGVKVAIASGGTEGAQLLLPLRAGEIIAAGGSEEEVWASLTTVPAELLGLSGFGSLHRGKSATMILFEGSSPFDASAPFKAHKPK